MTYATNARGDNPKDEFKVEKVDKRRKLDEE